RRLDVGREDEHADAGELAADPLSRDDAFVRVCRRHLDVDDRHVRLLARDAVQQPACFLRLAGDLHPRFLEQARDPLSRDHRVVGDHDPHGITAPIVVPSAPLSIETVPSIAPTRSISSARPPSCVTLAPPPPSSWTRTCSAPVLSPTSTPTTAAPEYATALSMPSATTRYAAASTGAA